MPHNLFDATPDSVNRLRRQIETLCQPEMTANQLLMTLRTDCEFRYRLTNQINTFRHLVNSKLESWLANRDDQSCRFVAKHFEALVDVFSLDEKWNLALVNVENPANGFQLGVPSQYSAIVSTDQQLLRLTLRNLDIYTRTACNDAMSFNNRGLFHMYAKNYDEALKSFEMALSLHEEESSVSSQLHILCFNLACAHFAQRKFRDALLWFDKTVSGDMWQTWAYMLRGHTFMALRNRHFGQVSFLQSVVVAPHMRNQLPEKHELTWLGRLSYSVPRLP